VPCFCPLIPHLLPPKPCEHHCLLKFILHAMSVHARSAYHVRSHVDGEVCNGVLLQNWWCRGETESLLWRPTQGWATWHALVSWFIVKIHYGNSTNVLFSRDSSLGRLSISYQKIFSGLFVTKILLELPERWLWKNMLLTSTLTDYKRW
jgi:hypothetical protein